MAIVTDGSRVCDSNRNALVAIDSSYVLLNRSLPLIYCGGVYIGAADDLTANNWWWRRAGGTFAILAATGEVKFGANTVLTNSTAVTDANKRTNQTATSYTGALNEWEGSSGGADIANIGSPGSGETQVALSFLDAIPGASYEFRCVVNATVEPTVNLDYTAKVSLPLGSSDFLLFPRPTLRKVM